MIIAIVVMMIGMISTFAYMCGIVTQPWIFILGQTVFVVGVLVAEDILDNMRQRIKKLEEKEKKEDA